MRGWYDAAPSRICSGSLAYAQTGGGLCGSGDIEDAA